MRMRPDMKVVPREIGLVHPDATDSYIVIGATSFGLKYYTGSK